MAGLHAHLRLGSQKESDSRLTSISLLIYYRWVQEKIPQNVKIHPSAWRDVKAISIIDEKTAGRIIQRMVSLGVDPEPWQGDCDSRTVVTLNKKGYRVKRLKCTDTFRYRIFYSYNRKTGIVCIYCIVPRDDDTYDENSWHYKRIKQLYRQWGECR